MALLDSDVRIGVDGEFLYAILLLLIPAPSTCALLTTASCPVSPTGFPDADRPSRPSSHHRRRSATPAGYSPRPAPTSVASNTW
jgi:hypothetical protein